MRIPLCKTLVRFVYFSEFQAHVSAKSYRLCSKQRCRRNSKSSQALQGLVRAEVSESLQRQCAAATVAAAVAAAAVSVAGDGSQLRFLVIGACSRL